jgi:energy-converting hydrogenase Eha subunit C
MNVKILGKCYFDSVSDEGAHGKGFSDVRLLTYCVDDIPNSLFSCCASACIVAIVAPSLGDVALSVAVVQPLVHVFLCCSDIRRIR